MKLLVSDGYFYRSMENESSRVLWFEVQGTVRVSIKVLRRSWVKFCFTFSKVIRDAIDNIRMQILEAFKLQVLEILLLYGIFYSFQCYTSSSLGFCISWSFPTFTAGLVLLSCFISVVVSILLSRVSKLQGLDIKILNCPTEKAVGKLLTTLVRKRRATWLLLSQIQLYLLQEAMEPHFVRSQ